MRVSEGISVSQSMRNGNFLKMRLSEIRVKQIHVNQGLGVFISDILSVLSKKCLSPLR